VDLLKQIMKRISKRFVSTETIIYHNVTTEMESDKCDPARCATHRISYDVSMEQIVALIEQSRQCRQFIKVLCKGRMKRFVRILPWHLLF